MAYIIGQLILLCPCYLCLQQRLRTDGSTLTEIKTNLRKLGILLTDILFFHETSDELSGIYCAYMSS